MGKKIIHKQLSHIPRKLSHKVKKNDSWSIMSKRLYIISNCIYVRYTLSEETLRKIDTMNKEIIGELVRKGYKREDAEAIVYYFNG